MHIVIYDTEYTTDEGWGGIDANPDPSLPRHIVQVGALKVDAATLDIVDTLDILCTPPVPLTPYFVRLTGITQTDVDAGGQPFPDVFAAFMDFCGGASFFSYGKDIEVLRRNLGYNNMAVPADWPQDDATNLRPFINRHAPETAGVNSGRLVEALGIRAKQGEHTGLADCHSIHETLLYLMRERGAANPFTSSSL